MPTTIKTIEDLRKEKEQAKAALDAELQLLQSSSDEDFAKTLLTQLQAAAGTVNILDQLGKGSSWQSDPQFKGVCKCLGIRKSPAKNGNVAMKGEKLAILQKMNDGKARTIDQIKKDATLPGLTENGTSHVPKLVVSGHLEKKDKTYLITAKGKEAVAEAAKK